MIYWVIGVLADPAEGRCEKYFTGHTTPGFHGVTTPFLKDAQRYSGLTPALFDRQKLAPRDLGRWTILIKEDDDATA